MVQFVKKTSFTGNSKVYSAGDDGLAAFVVGQAQYIARHAAGSIDDITDNSGGTPGSDAAAYTLVDPAAALVSYTGDSAAAKTEIDADFADLRNAIATVAGQVNAIAAKVPAVTITDNTGGTDGSGTIAAFDLDYTATDGAGAVDYTTFAALVEDYNQLMSQLATNVNKILYACGIQTLIDSSNPAVGVDRSATLAAIGVATGTAVDGTAEATVEDDIADGVMTAFADNIARMAGQLNLCTTDITGFAAPTIVAAE